MSLQRGESRQREREKTWPRRWRGGLWTQKAGEEITRQGSSISGGREAGRALYWASMQVWGLQTNRFRSFTVKLNISWGFITHYIAIKMYWIAAYLIQLQPQRLKNWELRERKKARDYAKDSEREDERRREMVRWHQINTWQRSPIYLQVLFYGCPLTKEVGLIVPFFLWELKRNPEVILNLL